MVSNVVFRLGSLLGYEILVLFVPVLVWSNRPRLKRMGYNMIFMGLTSLYVVNALKLIWKEPRPYQRHAHIKGDYSGSLEYSFPSGHSFCTVAVWMLVADHVYVATKKRFIYYLLFLIALFVGSSRIYHGVHYPHDVIAGYIGGLSLWMNFKRLEKYRWIMLILMGIYNFFYITKEDYESGIGLFASPVILFGAFITDLKQHHAHDTEKDKKISILYRVVIGCSGIGILFFIVEFTSSSLWLKVVAAFTGTVWMTTLAPKIFHYLKL